MSSSVDTDLLVRPMVEADLTAVLDLLQASLAGGPTGERTSDFFTWKHRANPFGASYGLVAEAEGRVVGVRLLLRWRFLGPDGPVAAVRPVDTATHPGFQGRGIFRRLTLAALDAVATDNPLVFNTPNEQSRPGYLKMGWQVVGRVPIALRPVRPWAFARGALAARRGTPVPSRPLVSPLPTAAEGLGGADDLLAEVLAPHRPPGLTTDRSPGFLRWRYADAPGLDYRAVPVEEGGRLVGLGLGRLRRRGPLVELTLSDVLVRPGDVRAARRVLTAAARSSAADHVATHLTPGTELAAAGPRAGYLATRRVGMTLTARTLGTVSPPPLALASWRFRLGDLEVF